MNLVNFKEYRTKFGLYEGRHVPLEEPMIEMDEAVYQGKNVELNKLKGLQVQVSMLYM